MCGFGLLSGEGEMVDFTAFPSPSPLATSPPFPLATILSLTANQFNPTLNLYYKPTRET